MGESGASALIKGYRANEPNMVPIKWEYVVPREEWMALQRERSAAATGADAPSSADAGGDRAGGGGGKQKNLRGQNKSRNSAEMGLEAGRSTGQVCRWVLSGTPDKCRFGPAKCRDSHDLAAFTTGRPVDLGPSCPVFALRGTCPSGTNCRWAGSHTDSATGAQMSLPEGERPVVLMSVNKLPSDVGAELRRGKYPFTNPLCGGGAGLPAKSPTLQQWSAKVARTAALPLPPAAAARPTKRPRPEEGKGGEEAPPPHVHRAGDEEVGAAGAGGSVSAFTEANKPRPEERAPLDLSRKIYVAPLTTVGNLPFRRLCVSLGAQVTCGEMALAENVVNGAAGEWALLRRHPCEKVFGIQVAGHRTETMARVGELIASHASSVDFVDINSGCPLDDLCNRGEGAALMGKPTRAREMVVALASTLPCPVTYKMRTGLEKDVNARFAHKLIGKMRLWSAAGELKATSAWEARVRAAGAGWEVEERAPLPLAAVSVHGRTRQQRYSAYADWGYIAACVRAGSCNTARLALGSVRDSGFDMHAPRTRLAWGLAETSVRPPGARPVVRGQRYGRGGAAAGGLEADEEEEDAAFDPYVDLESGAFDSAVRLRPACLPVLGNGDVLSWEEWEGRIASTGCETVLLGRGPLIKPWLCTEIAEHRTWDISSAERLDLLRSFVSYGLEHWGSDQSGVNRTRRFLLEWLSFLCRYVPVGLMERLPQRMNDRPLPFHGRDELETLMASSMAEDWVRISEMLLGPVPRDFAFLPKHKANSYAALAAHEEGRGAGGGGRTGVSAANVRAVATEGDDWEGEG